MSTQDKTADKRAEATPAEDKATHKAERQAEDKRRQDDDTNRTDDAARRDAEAIDGEGDYVLTLADGSRTRSASNVATEHNGQQVIRSAHQPVADD